MPQLNKYKIGFSDIGGVFIGKNIRSAFHQHYAISMIISFGKSFIVELPDAKEKHYKAALIQKNIQYAIHSDAEDTLAFIHIVPHSEVGLKLSEDEVKVKKITTDEITKISKELNSWQNAGESDEREVLELLTTLPQHIKSIKSSPSPIDPRVIKAIELIEGSEDDKLPIDKIAWSVGLSASHLARLLKKATGLTFREYVLHSKLTKSIYAMYKNSTLTEASFIGGFADQPHFTRTFKSTFGIKPSTTSK